MNFYNGLMAGIVCVIAAGSYLLHGTPYKPHSSTPKDEIIQELVQDHLDRTRRGMGVAQPLKAIVNPQRTFLSAYGCSHTRDAGVYATPHLLDMMKNGVFEEGALPWFLAHEIGHIQNNDLLRIPSIPTVISLAVVQLCKLSRSGLLFTLLAALISGLLTAYCVVRMTERQADQVANRHASAPALCEARDYFEQAKQDDRDFFLHCQKLPGLLNRIRCALMFTAEGRYRLHWQHPTPQERIAAIDRALVGQVKDPCLSAGKEALSMEHAPHGA